MDTKLITCLIFVQLSKANPDFICSQGSGNVLTCFITLISMCAGTLPSACFISLISGVRLGQVGA